jgi:hypothetical protein
MEIYTWVDWFYPFRLSLSSSFISALFLFPSPIFLIEMTSLNQGIGNSPDGYASLQIDKLGKLIEKLAYIQQSESGSYNSLIKIVAIGGNIWVTLTFKSLLTEPLMHMILITLILCSISKENLFIRQILKLIKWPQTFWRQTRQVSLTKSEFAVTMHWE